MTTSINVKKSVTIDIADTPIICNEFVLSKDKHAVTISMNIQNRGAANLLLSVNNFCLLQDTEECYAQHCYITDGQQYEVISGWKSFLHGINYTLITKFSINPNLSTYQLCYKTSNQIHPIINLEG